MSQAVVLDLATVREAADGDLAFQSQLLRTFVGNTLSLADTLRDSAASGDRTQVVMVAHTLKSILRTVGAADAAALAESIEGEPDTRGRVEQLLGCLPAVVDAVRLLLEQEA